jgi:hypothetical protein
MVGSSSGCTVGRQWRGALTGPLYVPEEGRYICKFLEAGEPDRLVGELERLSSLGSPWASAALGYLLLLPDCNGKRDVNRAIELCRPHARNGDPYALFVFAWALLYSGRGVGAVKAMRNSALSGFPPARLDFVTFVWNGWGTKERYPSVALTLLRRAARAGHKAELLWRCRLYASGQFGLVRRLFGYLVTPIALLRYLFAFWADPFSCRVFVFQTWATSSLLKVDSKPSPSCE